MVVGLLICTFNRPDYLRQCLDSIRRAEIPPETKILIVDDCSTDEETKRLIIETNYSVLRKSENKSIKDSLLQGCDYLFSQGVDVIMNLDSDAIVRSDFIKVILMWRERYPEHIVTGFNCVTKNKNGTERHKILGYSDGHNWKASVGGINMCFDKNIYEKWIRPSLVETLESGGNWDHKSCLRSAYDGKFIICAVPSVVQHIGTGTSSMGHSKGGEPPDVADDFIDDNKDYGTRLVVRKDGNYGSISHAKLYIPSVTLIAVDDDIDAIIKAADISCKMIQFAAVKLLSSQPSNDSRSYLIRHLGSKKEYSQFMLKEIVDYIYTPYFIVIQRDGFILDYTKWSDDFLKYDYCGAVWFFRDHNRIGNGGCSIRSRRLHEILKKDDNIVLKNDHIIVNWAEDHNIGYIYRDYLEAEYDIKFAPEEVCNRFSFEGWGLKPPENKYKGSFAFHGFSIDFNDADLPYVPYKLPNRQIL